MEHIPFDKYGWSIPCVAGQNGEKVRIVWEGHAILTSACKAVETGKQRVMGADSLWTLCEPNEPPQT